MSKLVTHAHAFDIGHAQGWRAYAHRHLTDGRNPNPYPKGTAQHDGFEEGWAAALRLKEQS